MRVDARSTQVTEARRVQLLLVGLGAAFLILTGLKPLGLPYIPGARFSDAATSHWGSALFLQRSVVRDGEFPFWRETILGGQPFAANPLNKTAYPLQWLALFLPPALHINLMIVLHLLIAGAGMWTLTRLLGLGAWSAGVSVIAYALSPRMVGHLGAGHVDIVYALAWLPWVLWAVKRAAQGSRRGLWAAGLFAGLMFLADVRLSLFGLTLAGAYGVVEVVRNRTRYTSSPLKIASLLRFLLPSILFLLIAAALLVPFWFWSGDITRAGLTAEEASLFSLQPEYLLGVVFPQSHRNPEVLTYLGIVPLTLAILGAITNPRRLWLWLTAALIAALYALGSYGFLWTALAQVAPFIIFWFRVPSRAWLIVTFVVALLVGYGVERLKRRPLQIGVLLVIALELTLTGRSWLEWRGDDYWLPADQRELAETLIADGVDRVYSPTYSLEQQVAEQYELKLFYGVDPFQLEDNIAWIRRVGGIGFEGYSVVQPPLIGTIGDDFSQANRDAVINPRLMAIVGISHVIAAYPLDVPQFDLLYSGNQVYLYRNGLYRQSGSGRSSRVDAPLYRNGTPLTLIIAVLAILGGVYGMMRAKD